jgi:hypothetical protein
MFISLLTFALLLTVFLTYYTAPIIGIQEFIRPVMSFTSQSR